MPLAARMRPVSLEELAVGSPDLLAPGSLLRTWIETDRVPSLIFCGPAGSGKTSFAHVIEKHTAHAFVALSAVTAGVREIRAEVTNSENRRINYGQRTILFVDEIHRFSKSQQDALLPHVEDGTFTLLGATTENPSYSLNSALLSRVRVMYLPRHSPATLERLLENALSNPDTGLGGTLTLAPEAVAWIAKISDGDARKALATLDVIAHSLTNAASADRPASLLNQASVEKILSTAGTIRHPLPYDKDGSAHHDAVSALIKSMRNGEVDAAVYYLARMLHSGEDPLFIARRLVIFASEDIGIADPRALTLAIAAKDAVHFVGLPEGRISLSQAVIYLALAPKSRSCYLAIESALSYVSDTGTVPIPFHLRNSVNPAERPSENASEFIGPREAGRAASDGNGPTPVILPFATPPNALVSESKAGP